MSAKSEMFKRLDVRDSETYYENSVFDAVEYGAPHDCVVFGLPVSGSAFGFLDTVVDAGALPLCWRGAEGHFLELFTEERFSGLGEGLLRVFEGEIGRHV